jgi:hypothetical protein
MVRSLQNTDYAVRDDKDSLQQEEEKTNVESSVGQAIVLGCGLSILVCIIIICLSVCRCLGRRGEDVSSLQSRQVPEEVENHEEISFREIPQTQRESADLPRQNNSLTQNKKDLEKVVDTILDKKINSIVDVSIDRGRDMIYDIEKNWERCDEKIANILNGKTDKTDTIFNLTEVDYTNQQEGGEESEFADKISENITSFTNTDNYETVNISYQKDKTYKNKSSLCTKK